MKKIGLISDTHGLLDERIFSHFKNEDEIWHAGDWGSMDVVNKLQKFKPLRGVWGNIDGQNIRMMFPKNLRFFCEKVDVWLTHIGGYPGKYDASVKHEIVNNPPKLFVCGHSHILKVKYDKTLDLLHINPGAAGKYGFQQVQTLVRFVIDGSDIRDLEVIELSPL
ncbi:MAG: metallophosphoesterase family protein [Paludibacteraceae bacterium]